jgi:hypothetical protein
MKLTTRLVDATICAVAPGLIYRLSSRRTKSKMSVEIRIRFLRIDNIQEETLHS